MLASPMENVCWTRMQAEAGEGLERILKRKEIERSAGDGLFFWGVGNAPARAIPALSKAKVSIDVIFSVMKSKPKAVDVAPAAVVAWRGYVDAEGVVRSIPRNVLVTSRASRRDCHYALICRSDTPLAVADQGPFDPTAFRNFGAGRGVGASQVTALLERCAPDSASDYRIAMRASLTGSLWVKLIDPVVLDEQQQQAIESNSGNEEDWLRMVQFVRTAPRSSRLSAHSCQASLFAI